MPESIIERGEAHTIYLTDKVAPFVPYEAKTSGGGRQNHGFIDLRDHPEKAASIPEAAGQPGVIAFLEKVNAEGSPLMSLGCDSAVSPVTGNENGATHSVSGYVDIAFRDPRLGSEDNVAAVAQKLMAMHGPKLRGWATYALGVMPTLGLFGVPCHFLTVHINALGPSEAEAWENFNDHFGRLADVIRRIRFSPATN